ncbi:MAG: N-acetylneuraminate synthase family protein [Candidatus Omnitrophica bacterium]|nr:N-acetylneuraminate synthase family protein [Candidatus Omnitrophota bacterium]
MSVFFIAEIGINHNGDMAIAKKLIDVASFAGCDAVKFQKRTIDKVYSRELLDSPRESPWGKTQRAQKEGLEFNEKQYDEINAYCQQKNIAWFASAWDVDSQIFLRKYPTRYNKVASAVLTHGDLIEQIAAERKPTFISTGMSSLEEIDRAVAIFRGAQCPFELLHCNSVYPMPDADANLRVIETLAKRYQCKVGYSGHEVGLQITMAAVALGATTIERHITLDRSMYGSDQAASLEPTGLLRLVRDCRIIHKALGDGEKKVSDSELKIKNKLRPLNWGQK